MIRGVRQYADVQIRCSKFGPAIERMMKAGDLLIPNLRIKAIPFLIRESLSLL